MHEATLARHRRRRRSIFQLHTHVCRFPLQWRIMCTQPAGGRHPSRSPCAPLFFRPEKLNLSRRNQASGWQESWLTGHNRPCQACVR